MPKRREYEETEDGKWASYVEEGEDGSMTLVVELPVEVASALDAIADRNGQTRDQVLLSAVLGGTMAAVA